MGKEAAVPEDESFAELMARLRCGDEEAADRVFRRFAQRLIALARKRLNAKVRQKVDAEDVVQSVYRSFFRRQAKGQFDLDGWDGLWGLLARITLCKCGHHVQHFCAARRDVRREAGEDAGPDASNAGWEALAREPTPPEAVMLAEAVEGLMRDLEGRDRDIVAEALQGYTAGEICARLARPERTVYRVLARVKKRLQRESAIGGEAS
jgi:RNA polymerase sigma-70 factor (ECF subfamily)